MEDESSRIVDVHVYTLTRGKVEPLWAFDRRWRRHEFFGVGSIDGVQVACLTVQLQLELHEGYPLPPSQRQDVARLEELLCAH